MKNLLKSALAAALLASSALSPVSAYTVDPGVQAGTKIIPERNCQLGQEVCYARVTVNYNDSNIASGVWFATLPANAYILAIDAYVTTAFNAAGNNYLSIGATKTGTDFVATTGANASVTLGSTGIYHLTAAAGLGLAATGNTSLQTALNSAVPLYIRYQQTSTAATAGVVTVVITFAKNNDN